MVAVTQHAGYRSAGIRNGRPAMNADFTNPLTVEERVFYSPSHDPLVFHAHEQQHVPSAPSASSACRRRAVRRV